MNELRRQYVGGAATARPVVHAWVGQHGVPTGRLRLRGGGMSLYEILGVGEAASPQEVCVFMSKYV